MHAAPVVSLAVAVSLAGELGQASLGSADLGALAQRTASAWTPSILPCRRPMCVAGSGEAVELFYGSAAGTPALLSSFRLGALLALHAALAACSAGDCSSNVSVD